MITMNIFLFLCCTTTVDTILILIFYVEFESIYPCTRKSGMFAVIFGSLFWLPHPLSYTRKSGMFAVIFGSLFCLPHPLSYTRKSGMLAVIFGFLFCLPHPLSYTRKLVDFLWYLCVFGCYCIGVPDILSDSSNLTTYHAAHPRHTAMLHNRHGCKVVFMRNRQGSVFRENVFKKQKTKLASSTTL